MNRQNRRLRLESLETREMLTLAPELVFDIQPGTKGSSIGREIHEFHDEIYFQADDGKVGIELWKSDGTPAGTTLVKDIHPGDQNASSRPGWFTEINGELFFSAIDAAAGDELWKTDGSTQGTQRAVDIYPGEDGSSPSELTAFQGSLYFSAADPAVDDELWKSDGTVDGTTLLKDIKSGPGSSSPGNFSGFHEFNGFLYFGADNRENGQELWRTDGTPAGTTLVIDADASATDSWPTDFFEFHGDLYFTVDAFSADGQFINYVYRVDGETGIADRAFDQPIDATEGVLVAGDYMYFSGFDDATGFELYRADGTVAGTTLIRDIYLGPDDASPRNLLALNGKVYFTAGNTLDPENQRLVPNLWVTDGTLLGTRQLTSQQVNSQNALVAYHDEVFFSALHDELGWELFKTDGTPGGTSLVLDINAGADDAFPIPQLVFEDRLLFLATERSEGYEIWSYDGTTAEMIEVALGGGDVTDEPTQFRFHEFGNDLVFVGFNPFYGPELWIMRGSQEPTLLPGDANADGTVGFADFLILSSNFGEDNATWEEGDFDGDGFVRFSDFLILSSHFLETAAASPSEVFVAAQLAWRHESMVPPPPPAVDGDSCEANSGFRGLKIRAALRLVTA